jgi:hypothetical protein
MTARQFGTSGLWIIVLLIAASGCASQGTARRTTRPTVTAGEFGTPGCFYVDLVRDFEILDDSNLIVYAPGKPDAYHVHYSPPNWELGLIETIGFDSLGSQVCGYASDRMVHNDSAGLTRYAINGVYRLEPMALTALRTRFGLGKNAKKPVPQPADGATIGRELGESDKK